MKIKILDKAKKKKFLAELGHLGMNKIPELLIRSGKERIRAYSGSLSKEEIMDIWKILPIEGVGLYVGKETVNKNGVRDVRLSIEGLHLWQKQITQAILVLDEEQEASWFKGKNLTLNDSDKNVHGLFVAVQSQESKDFIGTGKISADGKTLYNYLPKERRRKSQTI